jgi:hypothetical protein
LRIVSRLGVRHRQMVFPAYVGGVRSGLLQIRDGGGISSRVRASWMIDRSLAAAIISASRSCAEGCLGSIASASWNDNTAEEHLRFSGRRCQPGTRLRHRLARCPQHSLIRAARGPDHSCPGAVSLGRDTDRDGPATNRRSRQERYRTARPARPSAESGMLTVADSILLPHSTVTKTYRQFAYGCILIALSISSSLPWALLWNDLLRRLDEPRIEGLR